MIELIENTTTISSLLPQNGTKNVAKIDPVIEALEIVIVQDFCKSITEKGAAKGKAIDLVDGELILKDRAKVKYDSSKISEIFEMLTNNYSKIDLRNKENIDTNLVQLMIPLNSSAKGA